MSSEELVYVKNSGIHNKGIFAAKDISKGIKIIEFTGEKITKEESIKRIEENEDLDKLMHIFEFDDHYDIDGSKGGNESLFFNHCCTPNCEVEDSDEGIWFYATEDIKKGDELTFDYNCCFNMDILINPCRCGSCECRGTLINEEDYERLKEILSKNYPTEEEIEEFREITEDEDVDEIRDLFLKLPSKI